MAIQITNLTKKYRKNVIALDNVNFTFDKGKITGLLGRNGSGKSTLLSIISNQVRPDIGEVTLDDENIIENYDILSDMSICSPNRDPLYSAYTVQSLVKQYKLFYHKFDSELCLKYLETFELDIDSKNNISSLSTGYKNIVKAVFVLCTNTSVMLLDEPFLGLDPNHRELLSKLIIERYSTNNNTIIISTHIIDEVSAMVENVCILDESKSIYSGDTESLLSKYNSTSLQDVYIEMIKEVVDND